MAIGKTDAKEIASLVDEYKKRLGRYIKFQLVVIPDLKNNKNLTESQQKEKEGELILAQIETSDLS